MNVNDIVEVDGCHDFLSEELMVPNAKNVDAGRLNLFCSHLLQSVVLKTPEKPIIFSNFENKVGKYNSSLIKLDDEFIVKNIISKNKYVKSYILVNEQNKKVHIIERQEGENLTEQYGYLRNNSILDNKKVNNKILKDEILSSDTSYDNSGNLMYGVNLKICWLPYDNLTFEDAMVISESAVEKLKYFYVEEVEIPINNNDILLNLYGDLNTYIPFPVVGEYTSGEVLVARRRIDFASILYDFNIKNLIDINHETDTVYYGSGKVIDADIFYNSSLEELESAEYNESLVELAEKNKFYYLNVVKTIEDFKYNGYTLSDDAAFFYKKFKNLTNPDIKFRSDNNKEFSNVILKLKLLKENKPTKSSKLTNRYGGKGVISKIVPDYLMPISEDGTRAEMCLNPLGIMNRMNLAQIIEVYLTYILRKAIKHAKTLENGNDIKYLFGIINEINPDQYEHLIDWYESLNKKNKEVFIKEILDTERLYLLQPPFHDNISFNRLVEIVKSHPEFSPEKAYIHKDIIMGLIDIIDKDAELKQNINENILIEKPLIISDMYMLVLKHTPKSKFTARSTSFLNLKNMPSKSKAYKFKKEFYSNTPIRLGEQEVINLMMVSPKATKKLLNQYSNCESDRKILAETLLTENVFNINNVEIDGNAKSLTQTMLNSMLNAIGLSIEVKK